MDGNGFILAGSARNDQSGRSVSSAGDVNGDGYDDLIIGAYVMPTRMGLIRVRPMWSMAARARRAQGVCWICRALDGTNGFVLNGIDGDDYSGRLCVVRGGCERRRL